MTSVTGEDSQMYKWHLDTAAISASENVPLAAAGSALLLCVTWGTLLNFSARWQGQSCTSKAFNLQRALKSSDKRGPISELIQVVSHIMVFEDVSACVSSCMIRMQNAFCSKYQFY